MTQVLQRIGRIEFVSRACALSVAFLVLWLAFDTFWSMPEVPGPDFLTSEPTDLGRAGGIGPVLLSTAIIVCIAVACTLPIAFGAAALYAEVLRNRPIASRVFSGLVNVLVGMPSVVIGLIGIELFVVACGLGYSILAGALTLILVLAPVMTAAFIAGFDAIGWRVREQALCLGLRRWRVFAACIVPAARPALVAGVILAIGRAFAETAAVILTSGISTRTPESVFDPGATLAVHVYQLTMSVPGGQARAYSAAFLLILVSLVTQVAIERLRTRGRQWT